MATSIVQIRMDPALRDAASETFENLGLDLPTAIRIFLKKSVDVHGIPFDVRAEIPSGETLRAIENVENGRNLSRSFSSVAELMEDLNADDQIRDQLKKDYKRIIKRGYDSRLLEAAISILAEGKPLPKEYHDHPLVGNYVGYRECHITPDWLLIYKINDKELLLFLTRTGTHSDLFIGQSNPVVV